MIEAKGLKLRGFESLASFLNWWRRNAQGYINGEIILQGQKDEIKDQHAIVKDDTAALLPDYENHFVCISISVIFRTSLFDNLKL